MLKYNLTWALLLWWDAIDNGHHRDYARQCAREVIKEHMAACSKLGLAVLDSPKN